MLDPDCVQQFGNAASSDELGNGIFRDCSRAFLASASDQDLLNSVPNNFASHTAGPTTSRHIEAFACPPVGIATGGVHCCFETTGQCLSQLIASHKQALTMCGTCVMKFELLGIWLVVGEPVLTVASRSLCCQRL